MDDQAVVSGDSEAESQKAENANNYSDRANLLNVLIGVSETAFRVGERRMQCLAQIHQHALDVSRYFRVIVYQYRQ